MATTLYLGDRGNNYHAQAGVNVKMERLDYQPGCPEKYFAKGPEDSDWFLCQFDSHGNVCDADGIVVYPSNSGKYPAKKGDKGYFGKFKENFTDNLDDPQFSHLPSVHDDVYSKN